MQTNDELKDAISLYILQNFEADFTAGAKSKRNVSVCPEVYTDIFELSKELGFNSMSKTVVALMEYWKNDEVNAEPRALATTPKKTAKKKG
jgi:hypothetical protein